MIDRFPGLFAYLQQTFAYVTPPLVAVFLLGLYTRIGARAALYGTFCGHGVSVLAFVGSLAGWHDVHFYDRRRIVVCRGGGGLRRVACHPGYA
ncbi:solute:Na+ symporter, SSS family [Fontimonas thermophila]|uniref:Solute:Na+ symporter, SSS family n=2 Tax=Fontimonas thermophila TaxID=1076937 RepID=A0A1I2K642_9GAMM|nr:solute:Na+ symporter, SSS family [Fontimonas thermophila]